MSWHDHRGHVAATSAEETADTSFPGLDPRVWRKSKDGEYWEMLPEVKVLYRACLDKQLEEWLEGNNVHTTNLPPGIQEECCPDMSCCNPAGAWPKEMRQQFMEASDDDRHRMMLRSLGALFKQIHDDTDGEVSVHVAGMADDGPVH